MSVEQLRIDIAKQIQATATKYQVQFNYQPLYEDIPAFEQADHSPLVKLVEKLTGHSCEAIAFATEAPYIQQIVGDTLVLGAGSINQAHQPNEFLPLSQIVPYTLLLRQLISHYCL